MPFRTNHANNNVEHGSALRIRLSPHSQKVYSTGMTFQNAFEAKRACAKLALEHGVLDFIKFGNGQTQPAVVRDDQEWESARMSTPPLPSPLSLQEYYEALPRPFPEPFGDKTAVEINAPAWLNVTVQSARGGKLTPSFIWFSDGGNGRRYFPSPIHTHFIAHPVLVEVFGCVLRIERSGEPSRSYLVDSGFAKRADAKSAVCLQAMSEGLGDYIRAISASIESKVTPEMRKYVTERVYPVLAAEYAKFRPGTHPSYDYEKDKDGTALIGQYSDSVCAVLIPAFALSVRLYYEGGTLCTLRHRRCPLLQCPGGISHQGRRQDSRNACCC